MAIRDNLNGNIEAVKKTISSPYIFKGSTTFDSLPTTGNEINDTYYCTDKNCKYTWNGNGWFQSSLNETEYQEQLSALSDEMKNNDDALEKKIDANYEELAQKDEDNYNLLSSEIGYISENENLYIDGISGVYPGNISVAENAFIYNADCKTVYIECEPNTTYVIKKEIGARFIVGDSSEEPKSGVTLSSYSENNSGSEIVFTTSATAKYLCAYVYTSAYDTVTSDEMLTTVSIVEFTAKDNVARKNMEVYHEKVLENISGLNDDIVNYIRENENLYIDGISGVYPGNISVAENAFIYNADCKTVYIECEPNTTYVIKKEIGARFIVGDSSEEPKSGVTLSSYSENNSGSEIVFTTSATAKYLCAYVYTSAYDTVTSDEMLTTVSIVEFTAKDNVARRNTSDNEKRISNIENLLNSDNANYYFPPIVKANCLLDSGLCDFSSFSCDSVYDDIISYIDTQIEEKNNENIALNSNYAYAKKYTLGKDSTNIYDIHYYVLETPTFTGNTELLNYVKEKPTIIIIAGQHGDEVGSQFSCAYMIDLLTNHWQENEVLTYIHWNLRLVIVPCANPYGCTNKTYKNGNGINLNRDWDYNFVANLESGNYTTEETAMSQNETVLLKGLMDTYNNAVHIIDFHTNNSTKTNAKYETTTWMDYPSESELLEILVNGKYVDVSSNFGIKLQEQFNNEYSFCLPDAHKFLYTTSSTSNNLLRAYATKNYNTVGITFEVTCKMPNDEDIYNERTNKINTESILNWLYAFCEVYERL